MIRLSKSCLSDSEKRAVMGVLDREFLGMGAEVEQFEAALGKFFGRPAVCVSTGTAALHLALQAAGIGAGDEVLVQSLTYVASFQAISATNAKPVACEVDPATLCLDWRDAERRLTPNTKAVMPVHYAGGVGALDEIYEFAEKHNLRVIEDAAHAFGSRYRGERIGSFGHVACFSFDGIKNITAGEGGCIVTDDEAVLSKVRDARLLGVENDSQKRFTGERSWQFDITNRGWRYHMSNIMAAIGLEQLNRFPELAASRQRHARAFDARLSDVSEVQPLVHNYDDVVPHIYVIKLQNGLDRQRVRAFLAERAIQTGAHYQPNHWLSLYRKLGEELSESDKLWPRVLTLPLHPDLSEKDVDTICDAVIEAVRES